MEKNTNQFVITVGSVVDTSSGTDVQSRLDTTNDLRLLKAALLYSDRVHFHSYGASALLELMNKPPDMTENERLEWFLGFYRDLGNTAHIDYVTKFVEGYKASRNNKRGNYKNYLAYKRALDKSFRDMERIASEAGIDGLNYALTSGFVDFKSYARDGYDIEDYFDAITSTLLAGDTYPLFDSGTGQFVQLAIREKRITLLGSTIKRSKSVGLSSKLIERLPLFDFATVNEILDIRKELAKLLIRFRSGIMEYSSQIESIPWDTDFPNEIESIYYEHIEPSILEIEEAYKTNKSLLDLIPSALKHKGVPAASALGIALSQVSQFPETVVALSMTAGLTLGLYDAVKARREKLDAVKSNQLFFYYRAGELISRGKS